eukprot:183122-Pyramimonas_sp.AAC.1
MAFWYDLGLSGPSVLIRGVEIPRMVLARMKVLRRLSSNRQLPAMTTLQILVGTCEERALRG